MTALNHALTGALVAVAINKPILSLLAAFLSHFAIDSLPHWNYRFPRQRRFRPRFIFLDMLLSLVLLAFLAFTLAGIEWWLVLAGGFLAILPDMMWFPYLILGKNTPADTNSFLHRLRRFHLRIQWSETPKGLLFELAWFALMLVLLIEITD